MTEKISACCICGEQPTVRSHLYPSALYKSARGDETKLLVASDDRDGVQFTQSGHIDKTLLCAHHEDLLNPWDTYGVAFLRDVDKQTHPPAGTIFGTVSNPEPEKLVRFALACLWRPLASYSKGRPDVHLGKYDQLIKQAIFEDKPAKWVSLLVSRTNYDNDDGNGRSRVFLSPKQKKCWGSTNWDVTMFGVELRIKVSSHPWNEEYVRGLDAAFLDPVPILHYPKFPLHQDPRYHPWLSRAAKTTWRYTPRK